MDNVQNKSIVSVTQHFQSPVLLNSRDVSLAQIVQNILGPKQPPPPQNVLDDMIPFPKVKWRKLTGNDTIISSTLNKSAWNDKHPHTPTRLGEEQPSFKLTVTFHMWTQRSDCWLHGDSSDRHTNIRLVYVMP